MFQQAQLITNRYALSFTPVPGTNHVFVNAVDNLGNFAVSEVRSVFFCQMQSPLHVVTVGPGNVIGAKDGELFAIGRRYTVSALALRGQALAYWQLVTAAGTNYGYQKNFDFFMSGEAVLSARFVTNSFSAFEGNYNGWYQNPEGVTPPGGFAISATRTGAFSGKLRTLSGDVPFWGQLAMDSQSSNAAIAAFTIRRPLKGDLYGEMRLNLDSYSD